MGLMSPETQAAEVINMYKAAVPSNVELTMETFENAQGLKLQTFRFFPKSVPKFKGLIMLAHGYSAYTAFDWFLAPANGERHTVWEACVPATLVDTGYAVCTLDYQSHGLSEGARGLRGFFEKFDDLPQDCLDFLDQVVLKDERLQGLPVFVLGISLGGAVAIRMAQMRPELIRGTVLYGPMISLEEIKKQRIACCVRNGHLQPVLSCLDALIPTTAVAESPKNTVHPHIQKEKEDDPLNYNGKGRVRVAKECSGLCDWFMQGGLRGMKVPFITYHAINDTFTDPLGSQRLMEMAESSDKTHKTVGPGQDIDVSIWHNLQLEPGYEKVLEDALKWISERTSSSS